MPKYVTLGPVIGPSGVGSLYDALKAMLIGEGLSILADDDAQTLTLVVTSAGEGAAYACEADEAIAAGQPVALTEAGHAVLAGNTGPGLAGVVGFALVPVAAGHAVTWSADGAVSLATWSTIAGEAALIPGARYYLADAGRITRIAPTTSGLYCVAVGIAASPTTLDIEIQAPFAL